MKVSALKENIKYTLIPLIFVIILTPNSLKGWFGLADDHHFIEALESSKGGIKGIFDYFFQLQPWGNTTRFNPTQLFAWSVETSLFGDNSILWRLIQLLAVLSAGYAIGRATYLGLEILLPDLKQKSMFAISFQGVFLSLPFFGESIGRIGNPETFAAATLSCLILFHLKQFQNCNSVKYSWSICILNIMLIGFKENLLPIGLISLSIQALCINRSTSFKLRFGHVTPMSIQILYFMYFLLGFVPALIGQGQDIYGNDLGVSRFTLGKWLILPLGSLILLLLYIAMKRDFLKGLVIQSICVALVFLDYFIMGGKLSGHYGFVSGFVIMCQLLFFLTTTRFLGQHLLYFLIPAIFVGATINIKLNIEYLNNTRDFQSEIKDLRQEINSLEKVDVVIIIRSLDEYEAVSSVTSFARSSDTSFFLQNEGKFEKSNLSEDLKKAEITGNKEWHISPSAFRTKTNPCVEVYFSRSNQGKTCASSVFVSWFE